MGIQTSPEIVSAKYIDRRTAVGGDGGGVQQPFFYHAASILESVMGRR